MSLDGWVLFFLLPPVLGFDDCDLSSMGCGLAMFLGEKNMFLFVSILALPATGETVIELSEVSVCRRPFSKRWLNLCALLYLVCICCTSRNFCDDLA